MIKELKYLFFLIVIFFFIFFTVRFYFSDENIKFIKSQQTRTENIIKRHPEDRNADRNLRPIISKFESTIEHLSRVTDLEFKLAESDQELRHLRKQLMLK